MRLIPIALLSNVCLAAQSFQPLSFLARHEYGQPGTRDIAIADFNRDGDLDIAIADKDGPVLVLFGNSDGTFRPGPSTQIGQGLNFVVAGDFDGDGKADLAFATATAPQIFVALGNGDGTFSPPAAIILGPSGHLIVGDFNGDRKQDLAVCTSAAITILLGRGNGTFGTPLVTAVPAKATNLAAGDLNGDGKLDLVVTTSNGISVLLGNGNGAFQTPRSTPFQDGALAVAIADMDGDDLPDLALSVGKYVPQVAILLGDGSGAFSAPTLYDLPNRSESIAVGDLNGDGIPDVVTANVCVFLGKGAAALAPARNYPAASDPSRALLADLRRNGKPDVVTADWSGCAVSVLANRGDGTYVEGIHQPLPAGLGAMVVGDFNGDGLPDLAGVGVNTIQILLGTGDARAPFRAGQVLTVPNVDYQVLTADLNRDGKLDLVLPLLMFPPANKAAILLGHGDGTFGDFSVIDVGTEEIALALADFNGDGKIDLLNSGGSILLGNGDGTFQAPVGISDISSGSLAVGDFNGDGNLDFVAVPRSNLDEHIDLFLGNGDGTFQLPMEVSTGQVPEAVIAADFNGDGRPDLATTTYLNGAVLPFQVSVLLNNGNGTFQLSQFGLNPAGGVGIPLATDLNGDGITDLAIADGNGMMIDMYLGTGDGTFTFGGSFGTDPHAGWLVGGPFHGRSHAGKSDLVVTNYRTLASVLINQTR